MPKQGAHGAVLYGTTAQAQTTTGRTKWLGTYRTWEPKYNFGKPLPVPRVEHKTIWAETEDAARVQMSRWMLAQGLALGGILSMLPAQAAPKKAR